MSFSEIPPPPTLDPGQDLPFVRVAPPGPQSRSWLVRHGHAAAPMGPRSRRGAPGAAIVYATGLGCNVVDVDGNRYVDLAAGFGALLLGHAHPAIQRVIGLQSARLLQALGDLHPADARVALTERLAKLHPGGDGQVILGQSGADAITAALKTAVLHTGRPGVLAFGGAYHGLSYGPLAALGLRDSYRAPFVEQLNPHARFVPYPHDERSLDESLERARFELASGRVGAVLVEPLLGRGGCVVPPEAFLPELARLARNASALLVVDEIWTGLGRAGRMLFSTRAGVEPDLVCLGKGLGGGLPLSACVGRREVMQSWSRDEEVVHTATFAGAPLACATALATLDTLAREHLVERSAEVGRRFIDRLRARGIPARGAGLMVGIDVDARAGSAAELMQRLLAAGYITSTGGRDRTVLVLTPPLTIAESLLEAFATELDRYLRGGSA